MQLTWHGHSTWTVIVGETRLLIDPFFDNPKTSLEPGDVESPDFVLLTHGHADHVADADAFADATLVATPELVSYAQDEFGFDDGIGMNIGGTVTCDDAHVTMHRADHTNGAMTDYPNGLGMPTGFLIGDDEPSFASDGDTTTFYHAGDTALMTEMRDVIAPYLAPDAAAVPIGDHFTMGPAQAAIAVDWLDVDYAFPIHYDTFPPIEQDADDFVDAVETVGADAEVVVLEGDESFTLGE